MRSLKYTKEAIDAKKRAVIDVAFVDWLHRRCARSEDFEAFEQMMDRLRVSGATIDNATTFTRAFLNVEPAAIPGMASRIAMFAGGSPAVRMAQEILAHKERVIQVAEGDGFNREAYAGCNSRNLLYFALEFYEAKIMKALIGKVAKLGADSIAWDFCEPKHR